MTNLKTIEIDNRDTLFTIDTYQTFNADSYLDMEIDYIREKDIEIDLEDLEVNTDHRNVVKDLALRSIATILRHTDKDMVKNILYLRSFSPRAYNYTTDNYVMEVIYNHKKLSEWIKNNKDIENEYWSNLELYKWLNIDDVEDCIYFYLYSILAEDEYVQEMFEYVHEIYSDRDKTFDKYYKFI